jgi:ribonuclease HII
MSEPELVVGLDEAGRGPLAGPVIAAAVVLPPGRTVINGLTDSKLLAPDRRELLAGRIEARALAWAVGRAEVEEIDRLNILWASLLAMERAFDALGCLPARALVDGDRCPRLRCAAEAVVGGDASVRCISAASILAKVARDREMAELDVRYPGYGFARHKGYGTRAHLEALRRLGASPVHRRSFAPVRALLEGAEPLPIDPIDP